MWRRTFQVVLVVFFIIAVVLTSVTVADHEHPRPTSDNYSSSNGRAAVATQERTFFPILGVPNRIKAGHLTKGHGGAPKPSAQVGYPAPRPPRPPLHSYGPPNKPSTGYPGSNHQVQEVYITYPPTAGSASYPSGNYGPTTSVYPVTASLPSQGYLPSASLPPKPLYERPPVSYPSPNYESPAISYPQPPPINPDYSAPSKPSPAYPGGSYAPAPSHPAATGTGSYAPTPNYPAGGSYNPPLASSYPSSGSYATATSYPASTGSSSYNPSPASSYPSGGGSYAPATSYPAASGGGTYRPPPLPSYPATSGSYHPPSSHPGPSYAPVFVFIPKPGAFPNAVPAQKPVYQPSYPPVRPPPLRPQNQQQYYPAPIKPPHKPIGSYPAAKPPSTSYGLPKAQPITTSNSAYRTDRFNNNDAASKVVLQKQKPQITYQSISSSNWPPPTVVPAPSSISNQNTLFQRGNAPDTIKNTQFSKQIPSSQTGSSSLFNRTNLLLGAESIETPSVAVLPANINPSLPFFREELLNRRPVRPNFQNDCGGSWIILDGPTGGKLIDPTEIQIEPISSFDSPTGRFPNNDIKNWNDRPDDSFVTFPPGFNDVPKSTLRPDLEFLIFSTTPSPSDINDNTLVSTTGWRKPTPSSILSNRPAQSETVTPLFNSQVVSNGFVIRNTANRPFHTLTSTENSIIFSSFITNESDGSSSNQLDNPTPLSVNTADTEISIAKSVGQNKKNRTAEEIQQLFDGETTNSIIRLLREANLKAISALMDQAEIATLIQDQDYTLFAPSNAAFNQVTPTQRQQWMNRPDSLREMLLHHIVPGRLNISSLQNEVTSATLAGSKRLRINIYNTTAKAVVTVNGAKVLTPDLRIGSLLVHVIDRVLFPTAQQNILDILNDGGRLSSLQSTLLGPALSSALSSDATPLTVFIPTTEAFLGFSQEEQQLFLHNETAFHNLLWYHIVPGTHYSEGLEDGQWLPTLRGLGRLRVSTTRQNRKNKLERINNVANVVQSDITATNGVVHFIDRVLTTILVD